MISKHFLLITFLNEPKLNFLHTDISIKYKYLYLLQRVLFSISTKLNGFKYWYVSLTIKCYQSGPKYYEYHCQNKDNRQKYVLRFNMVFIHR